LQSELDSARVKALQDAVRRQRDLERLLSVYDGIRSAFGPSQRCAGIRFLTRQLALHNRFGDSQEDVHRQIQILVTFQHSGMSLTRPVSLFSDERDGEEAEGPANPLAATSQDLLLIFLKDRASRMLLEESILSERLRLDASTEGK
jgi:hypothetical protein